MKGRAVLLRVFASEGDKEGRVWQKGNVALVDASGVPAARGAGTGGAGGVAGPVLRVKEESEDRDRMWALTKNVLCPRKGLEWKVLVTLPFGVPWLFCPRRRLLFDPDVSGAPFVLQTMFAFCDVLCRALGRVCGVSDGSWSGWAFVSTFGGGWLARPRQMVLLRAILISVRETVGLVSRSAV